MAQDRHCERACAASLQLQQSRCGNGTGQLPDIGTHSIASTDCRGLIVSQDTLLILRACRVIGKPPKAFRYPIRLAKFYHEPVFFFFKSTSNQNSLPDNTRTIIRAHVPKSFPYSGHESTLDAADG